MGAINYGTSDIITVGYRNTDYYPSQEEIQEEIDANNCSYEEAMQLCFESNSVNMSDDYMSCCDCMPKDLNYYSIEVKNGYYDGFYICIKRQIEEFDYYKDKIDIQKEITAIKNYLIRICKFFFMRVVYPSWVTSYEDSLEDSIYKIEEAIKKERETVKQFRIVRCSA